MSYATRTIGRTAVLPPSVGADASRYQHLALRVISLALRDMAGPGGTAEDRASARTFFAGSVMFKHWCAVAQLDPCRVMRQASAPQMYFNGFSLTKEVKWRQ